MSNINNLDEIRKIINQQRRWDLAFTVAGVIALMIAVLTFIVLFAHMLIDGAPRLSWDFFHRFHRVGPKWLEFCRPGLARL